MCGSARTGLNEVSLQGLLSLVMILYYGDLFLEIQISKWLALLRDMSSLGFRLASTMAPQSVTDSVVAVHTLQVAGLAKRYVIPRFQVGKHDGSTVRDGLSGDSAHFPNGRPCQGICHP